MNTVWITIQKSTAHIIFFHFSQGTTIYNSKARVIHGPDSPGILDEAESSG